MSHRPSIIEQRIEWTRFRRQTDKEVLLAMARWFCWRADGTQVRVPVAQLVLRSGIPRRSVERALERLEADWWIEVTARLNRRPTTYRLVLHRLATSDPEAVRAADDPIVRPPEWRSREAFDRQSGGRPGEWRSKNGPDFEKVADERSGSEVRTEEEGSVRTPDPVLVRQSGGRPEHPDVPPFLEWARATYPTYASGARLVLDRERDGHLVSGLLQHYPLDRLQAMTTAMWTLEADTDPMSHASWIARSDRSLRVLRHKAAFLERVVVGAQQLALGPLMERPLTAREFEDAAAFRTRVYGGCPHDPKHDDWRACVELIGFARRIS